MGIDHTKFQIHGSLLLFQCKQILLQTGLSYLKQKKSTSSNISDIFRRSKNSYLENMLTIHCLWWVELSSKFDVRLFMAKNRVFKFDHQKMNTFESIRCSKNGVWVCSMFHKMVFEFVQCSIKWCLTHHYSLHRYQFIIKKVRFDFEKLTGLL